MFFLKAMQHIDGLGELRYINDAESACCIPNSDFLRAWTYVRHRLPVVWFPSVLKSIYLMACFAPGIDRKGT